MAIELVEMEENDTVPGQEGHAFPSFFSPNSVATLRGSYGKS